MKNQQNEFTYFNNVYFSVQIKTRGEAHKTFVTAKNEAGSIVLSQSLHKQYLKYLKQHDEKFADPEMRFVDKSMGFDIQCVVPEKVKQMKNPPYQYLAVDIVPHYSTVEFRKQDAGTLLAVYVDDEYEDRLEMDVTKCHNPIIVMRQILQGIRTRPDKYFGTQRNPEVYKKFRDIWKTKVQEIYATCGIIVDWSPVHNKKERRFIPTDPVELDKIPAKK